MYLLRTLLCLLIFYGQYCSESFSQNNPQNATERNIPWVTEPVEVPRVQYHIFYSVAAQAEVSYHIYVPDAYYENPEADYPVIYWLHGGGMNIQGLESIPFLSSYFNQGITDGIFPPLLVVFVNGLPFGMWSNSFSGHQPVESMLTEDLVPHIDSTFRTVAQREGRLLEGWSMGGYGAARLGFSYPDLFAGFSMLGAGPLQLNFLEDGPYVPLETRLWIFENVYGNSMEYFEALSPWSLAASYAEEVSEELEIRQIIGTHDSMLLNNRAFHAYMDSLEIDHTYLEIPETAHNAVQVLNWLATNHSVFYTEVFDFLSDAKGDLPLYNIHDLNVFPNPASEMVNIVFYTYQPGNILVQVSDIYGKPLQTIEKKFLTPGVHNISWNTRSIPSGVYTLQLISERFLKSTKVLLVHAP